MKKLLIGAGVLLVVLALAAAAGVLYMRNYFDAPDAKRTASLTGDIGATRMLGVFAHPDDEQLVTGLFSYAKSRDGAFTAMVTATRGEAGNQVPVVARQEDLGVVRMAEALKNGFALGVDVQEVWEYPDGGVPAVDYEELVGRIGAMIDRVQPDLVVSFWPASGATGHKDHMQVGKATEEAVRRARSAGGGPRWIAYIITPPNGLRAFGGETGAFVADNQPEATHSIPGNVPAKMRGWKIHASQEDYVQAAYGFPDWLLYTLWDREYYHVEELR